MKLCELHWNRATRMLDTKGLDASHTDCVEAAVAAYATENGGRWLSAAGRCPGCELGNRAKDALAEVFARLDADLKRWASYLVAAETTGNDGAVVFEAEEFDRAMAAKWGELWREAAHDKPRRERYAKALRESPRHGTPVSKGARP